MILPSNCHQASDLSQKQELAGELDSDQRDNVNCARKWLIDFNVGKTRLVLFNWSDNSGAIDVKLMAVLEEKSYFKMLELFFSSTFDWGSYNVSIAETACKKMGTLIRSMMFLSTEVALYHY